MLRQTKRGLSQLYGQRLRGVYPYGSYARGGYDAESDFDVLAVLDDFDSYAAEVDRTAGLASQWSLEFVASISQVFLRGRNWLTGDSPFFGASARRLPRRERGRPRAAG